MIGPRLGMEVAGSSMVTAISIWTCPQCRRRVPGREPLCHCGFSRADAARAEQSAAARTPSPTGEVRRRAGLLAALVAGVVGVSVYVAVTSRDHDLAAPVRRPRIRGQLGYPALPALPTAPVRRGRPGGTAALAPAPDALEQEWARAKELLDLPLRRIAADSSLLGLSYRPFAEACVDSAARDVDWRASLRTAALRSGVTLREKGATVDCETARQGLVARADALKSDLEATEKVAYANGALPAHWRRLVAAYELDVWDRY
jgi:hypothetical protein